MISLIVGILLIVLGVCLVEDFGRVATRLHAFFADFMDPGRATAGTFRLVGVFVILLGLGWVVTSFPLGAMDSLYLAWKGILGILGFCLALNIRDASYRTYEFLTGRGPFAPGPGFPSSSGSSGHS